MSNLLDIQMVFYKKATMKLVFLESVFTQKFNIEYKF